LAVLLAAQGGGEKSKGGDVLTSSLSGKKRGKVPLEKAADLSS